MATETAGAEMAAGSIDALKRVRSAEMEWDERLRAAKQGADDAIRRARDDAATAVQAARAEADGVRQRTVLAARADADREAAEILAVGAGAAAEAARGAGKHPTDRAKEILAAVLDGFETD